MSQTVTRLEDVRKPTHSEWISLGRQIDDSLSATLRSLTDDEWSTPTECEPWTVKDAVAHLIGWRLMPLLIVSYILNYLDRTNVSFAALTMNDAMPPK